MYFQLLAYVVCALRALLGPDLFNRFEGYKERPQTQAPVAWNCVSENADGQLVVGTTELALSELDLSGVQHVYIATDAPQDVRVRNVVKQLEARGKTAYLWEDLPQALRNTALAAATPQPVPGQQPTTLLRDGALISCIEQLICVGAASYLPSWPSCWDETVIKLRWDAGRADAAEQVQQARTLLVNTMEHFFYQMFKIYGVDLRCGAKLTAEEGLPWKAPEFTVLCVLGCALLCVFCCAAKVLVGRARAAKRGEEWSDEDESSSEDGARVSLNGTGRSAA
eukprot:TRINITY_DN8245_c0_g1_i1.p2 TRINITY_DN8245_c0_g1~~TRINITY_DN8245_c0_g1_i1.p2  ORF type:complete len:281 (+),score=63.37 TRINITY_DN8245_c0_g1_i1:820-1662(+)